MLLTELSTALKLEQQNYKTSHINFYFHVTDTSVWILVFLLLCNDVTWYCTECERKRINLFKSIIDRPRKLLVITEKCQSFRLFTSFVWSWDTVVRIGTGCGLDDRGVGFRVPVGSRIFSSSRRPDRLWGSPSLLCNGCLGAVSPGVKRFGAWSWPLTSNYSRGQENVDIYIHSPIYLHGGVLN
jgi:hypothetical protein